MSDPTAQITTQAVRTGSSGMAVLIAVVLGAFVAGCAIFVLAFAYAFSSGRDVQTADASLLPPSLIGERIPMIPVPR